MNPLDDDTTTRTGLWVVFSTVIILLISVIIWVLKGADGTNDAAATTTAAAAVAASAPGHGQDASTTAQGAAGHAVAQDAASSSQTGTITEEFVAFEQATPTQPAGAIYFTSASHHFLLRSICRAGSLCRYPYRISAKSVHPWAFMSRMERSISSIRMA